MANQLSSEDKSKRSVIRIIFYNNTYENEGKLYIDGECDTSLAEMDSLLNHKQMFLKFYWQYQSQEISNFNGYNSIGSWRWIGSTKTKWVYHSQE